MKLTLDSLTVCFLLLFALSGCSSSSGGRAPVSDLTINQNSFNKNIYKVQAGDTLYAIAWKNSLDVNTLIKRNHLSKPYLIHSGDLLYFQSNALVKPSKIKKTAIKTDSSSQKTEKKGTTSCTGQSCNKNRSQKVVSKKTKDYSAGKSDVKTVRNKKIKNKKVGTWLWPAKGKLTKTFSISKAGMKGISITSQRKTAVYAAASGKVVYAGNGLRGYGNLIIIKHNYDYLSAYAHNEKLLVSENDQIKAGQKIALMGDSGTDHVYLHFDIRYRGKSVDPLRYLPKR